MEAQRIKHFKDTVLASSDGVRAKKWLLAYHRDVVQSKENVHRSFKRREILVNGQPIEETRILREGDIVEVNYNQTIEDNTRMENVELDIRYQDKHLAVVWKAPGQNFGDYEKAILYALGLDHDSMQCVYMLQKAGSGLLIIAKTQDIQKALLDIYESGNMTMGMSVMCHGEVPKDFLSSVPDLGNVSVLNNVDLMMENEDEEDLGIIARTRARPFDLESIIKSITVQIVTRSNQADHLSTLHLDLPTPLQNSEIRRLFYLTGYPIIGKSIYTRYLKSSSKKGLCMSLTHLGFIHPVTQQPLEFKVAEPLKFAHLRERETKFWQRRRDAEEEQLKYAGVDDVDRGDSNKPLAYVLGEKRFFGLCFKIDESCLVPRPSSEILVEAVLEQLAQRQPARVLDVGTGCGNLLLSILHNSAQSTGMGVDISEAALEVARQNAGLLGLEDRVGWICKDMALMKDPVELYDVLVCNPPYLYRKNTKKEAQQMARLSHEPAEALFAGEEGFEFYRILHSIAHRLVVGRNGRVVLECGKGMMDRVKELWSDWRVVEVRKDRQGWDRCLVNELSKL
ncbi:S-adenosyl-L-methionine-dependent methyltransferase [Phycomyces nitens]|nr:S-adenosyl-L-methionine-dependent methyltransferase [Phycomyces nitens]